MSFGPDLTPYKAMINEALSVLGKVLDRQLEPSLAWDLAYLPKIMLKKNDLWDGHSNNEYIYECPNPGLTKEDSNYGCMDIDCSNICRYIDVIRAAQKASGDYSCYDDYGQKVIYVDEKVVKVGIDGYTGEEYEYEDDSDEVADVVDVCRDVTVALRDELMKNLKQLIEQKRSFSKEWQQRFPDEVTVDDFDAVKQFCREYTEADIYTYNKVDEFINKWYAGLCGTLRDADDGAVSSKRSVLYFIVYLMGLRGCHFSKIFKDWDLVTENRHYLHEDDVKNNVKHKLK